MQIGRITIVDDELSERFVRASGPGGQNVNKVSCAVQLRFDVRASSLPAEVKERLLAQSDQRINKLGVIVIKAQSSRSLEQNKAEALGRLQAMVSEASQVQAVRRSTKPTWGSKQRRLQGKAVRAEVKAARGKVRD